MYVKFSNLDKEKRDRIINAALKEFAQKGYKHASTNEIVNNANISKGLLFHYFKNKKSLFLFLYENMIELLSNEIFAKVNWNEKDVIKRLRDLALIKMGLLLQHPEIFDFILAAYKEDAIEIKKELEHLNKDIIANSYIKIFENIDTSLFKEEIDVKKAIDIIVWSIEGFGNRSQEVIKSLSFNQELYNQFLQEFEDLIDLLRKILYK